MVDRKTNNVTPKEESNFLQDSILLIYPSWNMTLVIIFDDFIKKRYKENLLPNDIDRICID